MPPSNWTQEAMEALRRLSLEAVRLATYSPGDWVNPVHQLVSDVCYRPDMVHDQIRGWWELRFPRGGRPEDGIVTFYRRSHAEAATRLCGNWLDELHVMPDAQGREITERLGFLDMIREAAQGPTGGVPPEMEGRLPRNSETDAQRDETRRRFLRRAYDESGADTMALLVGQEIAASIGLSERDATTVLNYLAEHELVREQGTHLLFTMTSKGIDEVEHPGSSIKSAVPPVSISIGDHNRDFVVQVGTGNNAQTVRNDFSKVQADIVAIDHWLDSVERARADVGLSDKDRESLESILSKVKSELHVEKPRWGVIRSGVNLIRDLLVGVAGSVLASDLLKSLPKFP
jgi:hypothetical protein